jgi:hypothetical protein
MRSSKVCGFFTAREGRVEKDITESHYHNRAAKGEPRKSAVIFHKTVNKLLLKQFSILWFFVQKLYFHFSTTASEGQKALTIFYLTFLLNNEFYLCPEGLRVKLMKFHKKKQF